MTISQTLPILDDLDEYVFCFRAFLIAQLVKKSAYNAGDPGSIPGSRRSAGEGICYPFQYSWAFLVGSAGKESPAMWETWVQSLGWEDPLEKGKRLPTPVFWP